jgi:RNA polymerase sigma-70 factor (subfamily 1)
VSGDARESADLLRLARTGSREALGALLDRCGRRLLGLIRLHLGPGLRDRVESRDVLQATLLKAIANIDTFEGERTGTLMAWLARIAANEIRDLADHHGRQRRDAARTVSLGGSLEIDRIAASVRSETSRIALDEQATRLERALELLAPEHREVIILRKLEELPFAEIGVRMSRSPDACRMLLARAMAALTMSLGEAS